MTPVRFGDDGLVPGIVQDARTGRVLMAAYLNAESLRLTEETGEVHFWSRSRREIWRKGATSGNTMAVAGLSADCDGDALLIEVVPAGPACHTGAESCFDGGGVRSEALVPPALWPVIVARSTDRPAGSYTASLLEGGVDAVGRKLIEEATEVLLAAKDHAAGTGSYDRVAEEAADLVYHLLVLLAERGLSPSDVAAVLMKRR
ncbi:MAG TPA: bifunctional phosphoribosyl-AMP cyclohydrolase/phosphoribosyl-ATP diphosphatase HisIE [Acidimicrobiia bacterium]|nr:bifunctional phosphoribosyl-AMP cyclohydrolase/phosphoribosyl-ATP diphosphatase HisIE [Acidimicrobiia bacterium]